MTGNMCDRAGNSYAKQPEALKVWTVLGLWHEDEPIAVGTIEGEHDVHGGEGAHALQGPWAEVVKAFTADIAESTAIQRMLKTLE
jgi:hypothetical protein